MKTWREVSCGSTASTLSTLILIGPASLHDPTCIRAHGIPVRVRLRTALLITQVGDKTLPFPTVAHPGAAQNEAGLHSLSVIQGTWHRTCT